MAFFRAFLMSVFCALVSVPAFAGVGNYDKRQKADWTSDRFSKYVSIGGKDWARCTGQYVAPNLILTAAHCYNSSKARIGYIDTVYNPVVNADDFEAKLVARGDFYSVNDDSQKQDWAVLLVENPDNYYKKNAFDIKKLKKSTDYEPVINAGFGWVRILSDEEILILQKELKDVVLSQQFSFSAVESTIDAVLDKNGKNPLADDAVNLKYSECNVMIKVDCHAVCSEYNEYTNGYIKRNSEYDKKKCDSICAGKKSISQVRWPEVLGTTCDAWGGNSGGASFSASTGDLVTICSAGYDAVGNDADGNWAVSSFALEDVVEKMRKKYPVVAQNTKSGDSTGETPVVDSGDVVVADNNNTGILNVPDDAGTEVEVEDPEPTITAIKDSVEAVLSDGDVSVSDVLHIANGITSIKKLEERYRKAKEKEHSFANRMISGVSMAATGIGGMQLAQGLAERSADAAAEQDMQAYLSTFTCKIGDAGGKSYKGGEMGIEVSGGNQLASLYQQYVDLAADLKERKNALGMAPGIESAVVMDKANMGLYDDTGRGIENGTYASLYRASKGNENDAKKLAEQKDTSSNRVKGGAIAAGAGTVVGVGGNILNNYVGKSGDGLDLGNIDIGKVAGAAAGVMSGAQ